MISRCQTLQERIESKLFYRFLSRQNGSSVNIFIITAVISGRANRIMDKIDSTVTLRWRLGVCK